MGGILTDYWDFMADRRDRKYAEESRKKTAKKLEENSLRATNVAAREALYRQIPSIGYHPRLNRMTVRPKRWQSGDTLFCHYDPKEFVEKYDAEWHNTEVTGAMTTPIVFKFVRPRQWSMKLLLNTLGGDPNRDSPTAGVDGELQQLRIWFLPRGAGGIGSVATNGDKPPVLLVSLIDAEVFPCCLTGLIVTRKAIHPMDRFTTRAEVDVVFTEFLEGSV